MIIKKRYSIADIVIELNIDREIYEEDRYLLFWDKSNREADTIVTFKGNNEIYFKESMNLVDDKSARFCEYIENDKFIRVFIDDISGERYAVLSKISEHKWECSYLNKYKDRFESMNDLFNHIAFEKIMLENNAFILHASLIDYKKTGILFSGVSGIGKSTQAALWEKYAHADILNGDKVILKKTNNLLYGYGSPFAGSSGVFKNKKVPIKALVFLEKTKNECEINEISGAKAFKNMYSQMIINIWNNEFVEKVISYIYEILGTIKIFKLSARRDSSSVECLKNKVFSS